MKKKKELPWTKTKTKNQKIMGSQQVRNPPVIHQISCLHNAIMLSVFRKTLLHPFFSITNLVQSVPDDLNVHFIQILFQNTVNEVWSCTQNKHSIRSDKMTYCTSWDKLWVSFVHLNQISPSHSFLACTCSS